MNQLCSHNLLVLPYGNGYIFQIITENFINFSGTLYHNIEGYMLWVTYPIRDKSEVRNIQICSPVSSYQYHLIPPSLSTIILYSARSRVRPPEQIKNGYMSCTQFVFNKEIYNTYSNLMSIIFIVVNFVCPHNQTHPTKLQHYI